MTPYLTPADLRVLAVIFDDAHRHGRMTDKDHDHTVITLDAAAQRQREHDRQQLEAVMG